MQRVQQGALPLGSRASSTGGLRLAGWQAGRLAGWQAGRLAGVPPGVVNTGVSGSSGSAVWFK